MTKGQDGQGLAEPAETPLDAPAPSRRDAPFRHWVRRAAVGDLAMAAIAAVAASGIRFGWDDQQQVTVSYTTLGVLVTLGWPVLATACGGYELRTSLFGVEELRRVLRTGVMLLASLGMAHFIFRLDLSRGYVGVLVPLIVLLTALWRLVLRGHTSRWMRRGRNHHQAVAVGTAADIRQLYLQLRARSKSPIDIVAFVADDLDDDDPVPAPLDELIRVPTRNGINALPAQGVPIDLLVRAGRPKPEEMAVLSQRGHDLGVTVAIAPHRRDTAANVIVSYVPLGSTPLLMVETPTLRRSDAVVKSVLDRALAAVFLVVLSPLFLAITLAIAVRDGRPVVFRQERVGRDGRLFGCLKFRTMLPNAQDQLPGLLDMNEVGGPLFKIRDDPRITRTGRWLRKHSLDELPQLWNVLKGDMSIVGPRPALASEVATFDVHARRRLTVKPGITGLWQIEGRSDLPWDEGVYLDVMYVDHWSPLLDFVIMVRTARVVIRPTGAY